MPADLQTPVRRRIIDILKAAPAVTALVPAARIFSSKPPANPEWPFIRCGVPNVLPYAEQCVDGSEILTAVHAFAKSADPEDPEVDDAEGPAAAIGKAIADALDGADLLEADPTLECRECAWTGTNVVRDTDDASGYHAAVQFRVIAGVRT